MQVQLVVELVAAGNPTVMSEEVYTYSSESFRTASYKCSGTVFNPHLERIVRRPPPPPTPAMRVSYGTMAMAEKDNDGEDRVELLAEKQEYEVDPEERQLKGQGCSWLCC